MIQQLTTLILAEAQSICMGASLKIYQTLRWQITGMTIIFNTLMMANNAGQPLQTLLSYVGD